MEGFGPSNQLGLDDIVSEAPAHGNVTGPSFSLCAGPNLDQVDVLRLLHQPPALRSPALEFSSSTLRRGKEWHNRAAFPPARCCRLSSPGYSLQPLRFSMAFAPFLMLSDPGARVLARGPSHLVYFEHDHPILELLPPQAFVVPDGANEHVHPALPYVNYASALLDILALDPLCLNHSVGSALPSPDCLTRVLSGAL